MAIITDRVEDTLGERRWRHAGADDPAGALPLPTTRIRSRSARAVLQRLKIFSDFPGFGVKSLTC
jgi:hypothetical protein